MIPPLPNDKERTIAAYSVSTGITLLISAISQYTLGQLVICQCGYIKLWQGMVWTNENSQHLTDWYSFSHVIHGFFFYYVTKFIRHFSLFQRFLVALTLEFGWELLDNTSFVIDRYRTTTVSVNYHGDSIVNSSFDILAMVVGFYLAHKLPWWIVILLTISVEILGGLIIRDNLTLNIIMLLYPIPALRAWQLAQ